MIDVKMGSHSTFTKTTVVSLTFVVGSGHVRTEVVPHLQRIRSNQPGTPEVGVEHVTFLFVGCVLLISDDVKALHDLGRWKKSQTS